MLALSPSVAALGHAGFRGSPSSTRNPTPAGPPSPKESGSAHSHDRIGESRRGVAARRGPVAVALEGLETVHGFQQGLDLVRILRRPEAFARVALVLRQGKLQQAVDLGLVALRDQALVHQALRQVKPDPAPPAAPRRSGPAQPSSWKQPACQRRGFGPCSSCVPDRSWLLAAARPGVYKGGYNEPPPGRAFPFDCGRGERCMSTIKLAMPPVQRAIMPGAGAPRIRIYLKSAGYSRYRLSIARVPASLQVHCGGWWQRQDGDKQFTGSRHMLDQA